MPLPKSSVSNSAKLGPNQRNRENLIQEMYYTNNGKSEKSSRNGKATQRLVVSERSCHPYAGGRKRENDITQTEKPAK